MSPMMGAMKKKVVPIKKIMMAPNNQDHLKKIYTMNIYLKIKKKKLMTTI